MGWGGALLALSGVQAINQIGAGYAQKAENELNATLLEGKAGLIDVQKDIEKEQYIRAKDQAMGTSFAAMAGMGIKPTGSPMAVLLDTQTQMEIDQAIGQFNLEQEKRYTMQEADAERRAGKRAVRSGWSSAFSTMLKAGSNYAMYKGGGTTTTKTTSFDTSSGATRATMKGGLYGGGRGILSKYGY